mmetsp:Transcript_9538/g.20186  ORF Transcript_9538/g.20186 Transcript_9538/m.20186 type:complete len:222 (-) Transcript_9538:506-1171(-)
MRGVPCQGGGRPALGLGRQRSRRRPGIGIDGRPHDEIAARGGRDDRSEGCHHNTVEQSTFAVRTRLFHRERRGPGPRPGISSQHRRIQIHGHDAPTHHHRTTRDEPGIRHPHLEDRNFDLRGARSRQAALRSQRPGGHPNPGAVFQSFGPRLLQSHGETGDREKQGQDRTPDAQDLHVAHSRLGPAPAREYVPESGRPVPARAGEDDGQGRTLQHRRRKRR